MGDMSFDEPVFVSRDTHGRLHNHGDEPALVDAAGTRHWWKHGKRHRDNDAPAVDCLSGTQAWWINDERHRGGDQPAVILADGTREWWVHNARHRDNDKPAVVGADGALAWWARQAGGGAAVSGRHRCGDQPAVIQGDGSQMWYTAGRLHREGNQPAVVHASGMHEWWLHGKLLSLRRVTEFREGSTRHSFVTAVSAVGCGSAVPVDADADDSTRSHLLVHMLQDGFHVCQPGAAKDHQITAEYALLVALFL